MVKKKGEEVYKMIKEKKWEMNKKVKEDKSKKVNKSEQKKRSVGSKDSLEFEEDVDKIK